MIAQSFTYRFRPLRIGWTIQTGDFEALRRVVKSTYCFWGGRYSPIIPTGDTQLAEKIVSLFRVDCLFGVSTDQSVSDFVARHDHIKWPSHHNDLFPGNKDDRYPTVADIIHPMSKFHSEYIRNVASPELSMCIHSWDQNDPLADVFSMTFGSVLNAEETGTDYIGLCHDKLKAETITLDHGAPITIPPANSLALSGLNKYLIRQHYTVHNYHDEPGVFVGRADNFDDLVTFWNLRATDNQLLFYDQRYPERFGPLLKWWLKWLKENRNPKRHDLGVGVWHRADLKLEDADLFGTPRQTTIVSDALWNGLNIKAPVVYFGEGKSLASVASAGDRKTYSFPLHNIPFEQEALSIGEKYVLSVDTRFGGQDNEFETLSSPYNPLLNRYLSKQQLVGFNRARSEHEAIGSIEETTADTFHLYTLNTVDLISSLFETIGIKAEISKSRKVFQNLIRQMNGLTGCRVFKIEGVRTLIERHSPEKSFSRSSAMQTILGQGTDKKLADYGTLYIGLPDLTGPTVMLGSTVGL